jgi:protein KTI12
VEPAALYANIDIGVLETCCLAISIELERCVTVTTMALITISGFPSSGKSTRAAQIQDFILRKNPLSNVIIISDHSLGLSPNEYSQSNSEKSARATLFAAVQRHMAVDTILIVDSLNYIKGFRYQLYCAARELKLRTCTVCNPFSPYH